MMVEASRIPPIHHRKFEIGRRVGGLLIGVVMAVSAIGSSVLQSCCAKSRKQLNARSQTPSIQMRTKRTRKLDSFWRSSRRTPLELARIRSVPAATPGRTEFGEEDTLSPLKLSS